MYMLEHELANVPILVKIQLFHPLNFWNRDIYRILINKIKLYSMLFPRDSSFLFLIKQNPRELFVES